jgi:hypothetical protein
MREMRAKIEVFLWFISGTVPTEESRAASACQTVSPKSGVFPSIGPEEVRRTLLQTYIRDSI